MPLDNVADATKSGGGGRVLAKIRENDSRLDESDEDAAAAETTLLHLSTTALMKRKDSKTTERSECFNPAMEMLFAAKKNCFGMQASTKFASASNDPSTYWSIGKISTSSTANLVAECHNSVARGTKTCE